MNSGKSLRGRTFYWCTTLENHSWLNKNPQNLVKLVKIWRDYRQTNHNALWSSGSVSYTRSVVLVKGNENFAVVESERWSEIVDDVSVKLIIVSCVCLGVIQQLTKRVQLTTQHNSQIDDDILRYHTIGTCAWNLTNVQYRVGQKSKPA